MNLSTEQIELIREYSSVFMTWQDIAILLQVDSIELRDELSDPGTEAHKAYHLGKTISNYEISKNLVKLAKLGSPQAEILVRENINRQENAENEL